ncbi:MAG: hypothetical protein GXY49_06425 [Syntrophomonadaceae bacterium]|nr:hypothetical protein [Syntrophomonadaceae bacterium]
MSGMKDSGIEWVGEIPNEWEVLRLKYVAIVQTGNTPTKTDQSNYDESGILWVKPDNLNEFKPIVETKERISETGLSNARIAQPKATLVCCIGTVGKIGFSEEAVAYNQQINAVEFDEDNIFWKYGLYFLSTQQGQHQFYMNGNVVYILNSEKHKNISIVKPPIDIQQTITNYLDHKCGEIDSVIAAKEKTNALLKEHRQSIIYEAVTKGLDPTVPMKDSGIEWIGWIPMKWNLDRLKFHATLNPLVDTSSFQDEDEVSFVPMENLKSGYHFNSTVSYSMVKKGYTQFNTGDILIAKVTPCFENGNIAIASDLIRDTGFGSTEINVIRSSDMIVKYLFYYLQNPKFIERGIYDMFGVAGLKRLIPGYIIDSFYPIPTRAEQQAIADYLDHKCAEIDSIIAANNTTIEKLKEYRRSIIYETVTGKTDVYQV